MGTLRSVMTRGRTDTTTVWSSPETKTPTASAPSATPAPACPTRCSARAGRRKRSHQRPLISAGRLMTSRGAA